MKNNVFGIDIGGTNTVVGLVNGDGKVLARKSLLTQEYDNSEKFADDIAELIFQIREECGMAEVSGIGIGAPNANFSSGCIEENTANFRMKERIPLCEMLEKRLGIAAVLSNDADAAALGERVYGGAKGCDNFVMVTVGTGVGSGFFVEGRLVHGANCMAGELGHLTIQPDGRPCSCGRKGCLETYTSARGICRTFRELAESGKYKITEDIDLHAVTCRQIGDMANAGVGIAVETFDITARFLAIGLANAVTFSNPEKIFLMGGPTNVGAPLLGPLHKYFEENLLFVYKSKVSIEKSTLDDNDAAILGAAALVFMKK